MIIVLCLAVYVVGLIISLLILADSGRAEKEGDLFRLLAWPLWFLCVVPIYISKFIYRACKSIFNIKWSYTLFSALMEDIKNAMESK